LIINGDMAIDQRNSGSSVSVSSYGYVLDRFGFNCSGGGVFTAQRNTTVPTGQGFTYSQKLTVTTADSSIASADIYSLFHKVEANNTSFLQFGTSSAKTITLSFWVRSSVTGTFGVGFNNNAFNRSYVATYSISSADTWEKKTITVAGDTSGTWTTDNTIGINISFDLGSGSNYETSANAWSAGNFTRTSGSAQWIATNSATFYITGVQLEVGTFDANSIPDFQFEDRGTSLRRCQRYYYVHAEGLNKTIGAGANFSSSLLTCSVHFPTTMRSAPSLDQDTGTSYFRFSRSNNHDLFSSFTQLQRPSVNGVQLDNNSEISGTQGDGGSVYTYNASAKIAFDSEL
jgi:hypothetical protein